MLDSQQIIISIDKRLADARKEIASLERALTAMNKTSKAADAVSATRTARTNGAAPAKAAPQSAKATAQSAKRTAASTNGRARRTRRAPAKGRAEVVPAGKLVSLLGTGNGMSTADLTTQTGGDRQQLLTLLRELEAAGQVRRSGERRGTRWHAITDEDRIAERVAQLERQSSRNKRASRAG